MKAIIHNLYIHGFIQTLGAKPFSVFHYLFLLFHLHLGAIPSSDLLRDIPHAEFLISLMGCVRPVGTNVNRGKKKQG